MLSEAAGRRTYNTRAAAVMPGVDGSAGRMAAADGLVHAGGRRNANFSKRHTRRTAGIALCGRRLRVETADNGIIITVVDGGGGGWRISARDGRRTHLPLRMTDAGCGRRRTAARGGRRNSFEFDKWTAARDKWTTAVEDPAADDGVRDHADDRAPQCRTAGEATGTAGRAGCQTTEDMVLSTADDGSDGLQHWSQFGN